MIPDDGNNRTSCSCTPDHPPVRNRSGRSGSAMIMVLLILGVLLIVSIPFLMSMTRHSTNARSYQAQVRTDQLADLGIQSASGLLSSGHTEREWRRRGRTSTDPEDRSALLSGPIFTTPYMDYQGELNRMRREFARFYIDAFDSRRSLGISIEDEQGKLNLSSAPDRVVNNLKSLLGPSERIEKFVTRHSVRPVVHSIAEQFHQSKRNPELESESENLNATRVRWGETRHPVNVNTADWKVLAATLIGLDRVPKNDEGERMEEKSHRLSRSKARRIAKLIKSKTPINGWYQFNDVLEDADDEEILTGAQKKMIMRNARKENLLNRNNRFDWNTSMPLCFHGYDTYTVQARGTSFNPAGAQRSASGIRSILSASPGNTSLVIESPYELSESLSQLTGSAGVKRNNSYGVILGPGQIFKEQKRSFSKRFEDNELGTWKNTRIMKQRTDVGHIQAEPNREGRFTPYGKAIGQGDNSEKNLIPRGAGYKRASVSPGGVKFWVRFDDTPRATSLIDTAESTYESRIHFYYKGNQLFLDVADPTLEKKYTRVVADWQPEADTWYHLGAFWKSTKYGHLAIMIDGHLVGETKMVNEEDENLLKTISASLAEEDPASSLNSLSPGYWEIGEEIVRIPGRTTDEMTEEERNNLSESRTRGLGSQPTTPHKHQKGSVASPYGFSIQLNDVTHTRSVGTGGLEHLDQKVNLKANLSGIPNMKIRTTSAFGEPASPTVCPEQYMNSGSDGNNGGNKDNDPSCQPPKKGKEWKLGKSTQSIPIIFDRDEEPADLPSPALLLIHGTITPSDSKKGGGNDGGSSEDSKEKEIPKSEVVVCGEVTENALTDCFRGALGTEPVDWEAEADVSLLGFPVDGAKQFPDDDGRLVQVDTEWIGPVQPYSAQGRIFLGSTNKDVPLKREVHGTSLGKEGIHEVERKVLPVFSLENEEPEDRFLPDGLTMLPDVTLFYRKEGKRTKQRVTIRLAKRSRAALDDFVPDHVKATNNNRLLKFPSGELLPRNSSGKDKTEDGGNEKKSGSDNKTFLGSTDPDAERIGRMSGRIANLKTVSGSNSHRLLDESVTDSSPTLTVRGNQLNSPGALKVGDELIGYPQTEQSQRLPIDEGQENSDVPPEQIIEENDRYSEHDLLHLTELSEAKRGYLESTSGRHNRGDRVFVLSKGMISVSALSEALSGTDNEVSVQNQNIFSSGYKYYRIEREILGLENGDMPRHDVTNEGMFRGAFGTKPSSHSENTMVFRTPHRYPDRVPEEDVFQLYGDMDFHHMSVNRPGAIWTGLSLDVDRDNPRGSEPRLLVRTDRETPWHRVEKRINPSTGTTLQLNETTDSLELLFLFDYAEGAYSATNWRNQHGWKSTTRIKRIELKYRRPSRTLMYRQQK